VSHFSKKRIGRIGVAVAGAATALTLGLWAQASAAQPSAPAQRIAAPPASASAPAAAGGGSHINIVARDYSFDSPSTVSTGVVSMTLQNQGAEPHHAQLARLNDGVSMEAFGGALMQGPEAAFPLVSFEGGPGIVDTGGSAQVTLNLTAGNYVMLCFVENDQGVPHLALGMIKPFQVAPPPSTAQAPQASGEMVLKDFSFEVPQIQAGERTLRVTNQGPQVHEMAVIRTDAPVAEVMQALANFDEEPPFEITDFGGMQAIDAGKSGWVTMNFTPGTYVLLCFVPDPETGAPHVALGMVEAFTVQ
jgi:uncharacterized cupredoxin-like copper-binding protein